MRDRIELALANARMLVALLERPEVGLGTWAMFVQGRLEALNRALGYEIQKEGK